jgi:hypothetical protein
MKSQPDKSNKLSFTKEPKKAVFTLFNPLAGNSEVKSVPQAMHEFIKDGFAKLHDHEVK